MRFHASIWLVLTSLLTGCVHGAAFRVRSEPACAQDESDPTLARERSYLALLIALDERRFVILRRTGHEVVEVELANARQPLVHTTHWLIWLQPDGALRVGTPPYQPVQHARSSRAYDALMASYGTYRCRQLDWLRWEAQNRGLYAIGNVERSANEFERERAASEHAEELAVLRNRRDAILVTPRVAHATLSGMVLTLSGVTIGFGIMLAHDCRSYPQDTDRTCRRGRVLLPVGGVFAAASATALAFSFHDLLRKLAARRALKQQIEDLSLRGVSLSATRSGAMLECALSF